MINFKRFSSTLLLAVIIGSTSSSVFAQSNGQSSNGFRISPLRNELTIEKGKTQTVNVSVENPSSINFKAKAVVNDFLASVNEDGQPELLLDGSFAPTHSLKRLVTDPPIVSFGPNERKEIQISISIPINAAAGGYYGAVRFLPADAKNSANVSLTASVGSLFLVNVPGNIKEHLTLEQFGAATNGKVKNLITSGSVSIVTRLKNDGDTHEKPFGKIQVKNSKGKVIAEQEINNIEPQSNILPSSIRKFETKIPNTKWLGHYTVTAGYGYTPSNGELITAKTSFWYIPLWLVAVFMTAVVSVMFIAYFAYRSFHNRHK
jgi:hypothetical protein